MNTPSHFLMSAAIRRLFDLKTAGRSAVYVGSVAPDLCLYMLTFGAFFYYTQINGWESRETFQYIFDYLYFNDPGWIFLHNFLHAPLSLAILYVINRSIRSVYPRLHTWMRWFLITCMLHSGVDILTHFDDGPLILFPFEWSIRFNSPVSYWDPAHYGREFSLFEFWLNVGLLIYLLQPTVWRAAAKLKEKIGRK